MNDYFVETSIKKIREASENNKLVVFVGAGVSANSGMPTWKDLIKEMAKDLGEFNVENSQDLYLKIPQYYYNERGEKEYFEKLNEVFFKKKYKPNPIHKEIFKLKPTHIITTNYDTLLEESAIEEGQFYHTVRDDLDLPYDNLNKTIIKMHGDFVNRNIVLKEDDYLNYSSNFTLIESYIKSLIATNTVLFIGYSVNDSNFNLIFQWVKNILNNHFQPAYLIESSKEYSRMEHAYYKNRGINILYYDEMHELQEKNVFNSSNWRGNRLFDVINYFNIFDNTKKMNELEYIYDKLSCFEKLNFIMPDQVVKSLKLKSVGYDMFGDRTLTILREENRLSKIFSNSEQYKEDLIFEKILMIFDKANIKGVSKDKKIIFSKDNNDNYLDTIVTNIIENDSLFETIDINNFTSLIEGEDYFLMLKQAYAYYENEKFFDAYKYYKTISLKAFQDKEYLIYYISEFNRKHVGHFLLHAPFSKLDSNIEAEIEELNLEDIYFKLPYKERKGLEFLNEIQDFNLIYKVQNKLRKEVNELKKTKRTVENGGFSVNSSLSKNFHIINNIWLFIKANYLCIDKYTEVQSLYLSFIEGVFASYSTKSESNSKGFFSDIKVNKIEELNLFEIYIIITKLKNKDLENVLDEYNLKVVNIEEQAFEYIMKILDTATVNILQCTAKEKSERYLYNLLTLISRVTLNTQQVNGIAEKLLLLINERTYLNEFKYINKFIVSAANREVISQETVLKYLEKYLKVYQQNRRIIEFDNSGLYRNLTKMYKSYSEYPIEVTIISGYLGLVKQYYEEKDYNSLYEVLGELVLPIIESLNDKHKNSILNVVRELIEEMENKEDPLNFNDIIFYYKSSIIGIITANKDINKKIVEDTVSKINNQKKGVRTYPDPVERNLGILTDLYREGCIQKQEIQDYASQFNGYSEYFDLVFNNKDLELNDIELLSYLTETETENVMKNDLIKEKVYSLLEKKFTEHDSIKIKNIFDKLYVKKF